MADDFRVSAEFIKKVSSEIANGKKEVADKKEDYETHALQGGDSVEFLYFMGGGSGADYTVADTVDITDVICPVTFVKAKVALEELEIGEVLRVHMNGGEPVQNVPRSMKEEGHKVLKLNKNDDGTYDLIVEKGEEE